MSVGFWKTIRYKRIAISFGIVFLLILIPAWLKSDEFEFLEALRSMEGTHESIFVTSINLFFISHHRLPSSALELDKFIAQWANMPEHKGWNELHRIVNRDHSFLSRHIGRYFGWDHPVIGYGKSYDDFDKYANKIQIGEVIQPYANPPMVNVYIPGCQSKLLYRFDKVQKNFLLLTSIVRTIFE